MNPDEWLSYNSIHCFVLRPSALQRSMDQVSRDWQATSSAHQAQFPWGGSTEFEPRTPDQIICTFLCSKIDGG